MSYQAPAPAPQPQRIRHDNSQSLNLDSGTKELLFTLGVIGVGAAGAYFLIDYVIKGKYLGNILQAPAEADTDNTDGTNTSAKLAVIEVQEPYDRYTRVNSYAAYRGQKALDRLPVAEDIDAEDNDFEYEGDDVGFNQVFTEDRVYEVV